MSVTGHRFFVGSDGLDAAQRRQIASVLRLRPGAVVTLVSDGEERDLRLERVSIAAVEGTVVARRSATANEPSVALVFALPLLRGDRTAEVVESVTQLGVTRIAPFVSARSVVRALPLERLERLRRVAREAAETARRARVPEVDPLRLWSELLASLPAPLIVAWEEERERRLEEALPRGGPALALVVGPEGGLGEEEVASARRRGGLTVTLGPRVLRSETAAVSAVARTIASFDRPVP